MQWTEALWLRQLSGAVRTLGKHVKENTPKDHIRDTCEDVKDEFKTYINCTERKGF